jgi:hypothetical protein
VGSLPTSPVLGTAEVFGPATPRSSPSNPAASAQSAATPALGGSSEESVVVWVPQTGFVRGTRTTIAALGSPLQPAPGLNRTVEACRDRVQSEATKMGAQNVEAVSAGPQRRNEKGQIVGPVRMRVTYARPVGYEVREAVLTCVVDSKGKVVDAYT